MKLENKIILTEEWAKDYLLKIVLTVHAINIYLTESKTQKNATLFILFIYFISIFILLTRRKATEALIHRVGNYPDLLPEMPRYCCQLVI